MNKKTDKVTKFMGPIGKTSRKFHKRNWMQKILGPITTNSQDSELQHKESSNDDDNKPVVIPPDKKGIQIWFFDYVKEKENRIVGAVREMGYCTEHISQIQNILNSSIADILETLKTNFPLNF
jgi:hypothetical protein